MALEPSRLIHKLQLTGLQQKDAQLYQLLYEMIGIVTSLNVVTVSLGQQIIEATSGEAIQQLVQVNFGDGDGGGGDDGPPGMAGIQGEIGPTGPYMPTFIPLGTTVTIPTNEQALFAMNIDNEGILDIEGFLIEVE